MSTSNIVSKNYTCMHVYFTVFAFAKYIYIYIYILYLEVQGITLSKRKVAHR